MKFLEPAFFCLFAFFIQVCSGQTFLMDFNDGADSDGYPEKALHWNRYALPEEVSGELKTTDGVQSTLAISQTGLTRSEKFGSGIFNNPKGGPSWVTNSTTLAETGAAADYFWTSIKVKSLFIIEISGLTRGDVISLDLFTSRNAETSTPQGYYEYSFDGINYSGLNVFEKDGTLSPDTRWVDKDTGTTTFRAAQDGNSKGRYMGISNIEVMGSTLYVRGQDETKDTYTSIGAARLTIASKSTGESDTPEPAPPASEPEPAPMEKYPSKPLSQPGGTPRPAPPIGAL